MPKITFVDKDDNVIGHGSREDAVTKGIVHRIARVFVFNSRGEILIQKRSSRVALPDKWDQSAAGHVDAGENYLEAASREAFEEIGLTDAKLKEIGKFYTEELDEGLKKKRFNTLYSVKYGGNLKADEDEVSEVRWIDPKKLESWMKSRPNDFTQGFIQTYHFYLKHS